LVEGLLFFAVGQITGGRRSVARWSTDYTLHKLVVADGPGICCPQGELGVGELLPGRRLWRRAARWWPVLVALLATIALAIGAQHWFARSGRSEPISEPAGSPAEQFADAAMAALTGSTTITVPATVPEQRAAGLPADPVAGLTSTTPAGPIQLVLPDGLDTAQRTRSGSVVYPQHGAGVDLLAENTGTGTRTVVRISGPTGVRMVTTFVRTPAGTVLLAHPSGVLTINRAIPTGEAIGVFSPAETRDTAGKLVPSSYVARQLRPGLYQLSEVIDPRPDTVWPVFGVQAVDSLGTNNPTATAVIVAGAAVTLTGAGGPAGAAAIAAAVANLGAAGRQIAAEAMPDNQALGVVSTVANTATMRTPGGAAKKVAEEGAEIVAEQVITHTGDVIDAAAAVPDPARLRDLG
jgi:hypothetical protein